MKSSLSFAAAATVLVFLFLGGFGTFTQGVYASSNQSEEDSIKCLQQLSVASLALEKEMYKHAAGPWWSLFKNCPELSVRIYSDGEKLFTHFIENSKDEMTKRAYLDTLMMVYDKRIEFFGDHHKYPEGWILGRKGMALVRYDRKNPDALKNAYECFLKSYSALDYRTEPAVMIAWIQTSRVLEEQGELSQDQFIRDYINVYGHVTNERFKSRYNGAVYGKILSAVEKIFIKAEGVSCQAFSSVLSSNNEINNLETSDLSVYLTVMKMAGCDDSDLYTTLVETNYKRKPTAEAAGDLARMFIKQGNYNRAVNYYQEAIDEAVNDSLKAVYYYELAVLKDGHFKEAVEARQYAKRASALLPGWGKPYLLLGSIYARSSNTINGNDLEKSAVYWAAVDQFMTAMQKDAECAEEAREQIDIFSQYFPDKQTCFFHGLEEGQEFVVGDWINEPTTVRF